MIKQIDIKRFDFGVLDEVRDLPEGGFVYLENVASGDNIKSLKQVGDVSVTDDLSTATHRQITAVFEIGTTIYGLGNGDNGKFAVWKYTSSWAHYEGNQNYAFWQSPFFVYLGSYIYFLNGTYVARYTIADNTINNTWYNASTQMQGGITFQGNLIGWKGQVVQIITIDGSGNSGTGSSITIPSDQTIVDLVPYRSYLAIICTSSSGHSKMYIWDMVSTSTFTDIVDEGTGNVAGGTFLDGTIKIVIGGKNSKDFRIRSYSGNTFNTEYYYSGRENTNGINYVYLISRVKAVRGFIYFLISGTQPNTTKTNSPSLVRYGNKISGTGNSFSVYKNFNTTLGSFYGYNNDFIILDNSSASSDFISVFASLQDSTSSSIEVKTTTTFAQAGVLETGKYNFGNSVKDKTLIGVTLTYEALPTAGQVVLKYKADADTSWTTLSTDTTDNSMGHETVCVEATGAELPVFKELALRIEGTGAAELTGISLRAEEHESSY